MKKILLSIMALCAVITASAETRSWDFTKGTSYATAISGDTDNWTLLSKGRYKNANALTDEELKAGGTVIEMTAGLRWTAAAGNLLVGTASGNLYIQPTGGNVIMTIPSVTKNDTIILSYCSSGSGKTASVSGNVTEGISTTSTSKSNYSLYATEDGDLALTLNANSRIFALTVKPYVAAAEGECKAPVVTAVGINPTEKAWMYQVKEGEEGETLTYTTPTTDPKSVNSGDTIFVKPGETVTVNATKGENNGKTEFTTPEFTKSETVPTTEPKSTEIVGSSYTIPANDNAGAGNGYNVKWRTNQDGNTMTINVKEGFALTKVVIKGKNNFNTGNISLKSFCVDGGESLSGEEFGLFNSAKDEQTITFTGVAKQSIVLTFGDVQDSANQFNADVTIDWTFADEATEATNTVDFAYKADVTTAISNVTAAKAQNGKFLQNGKIVIMKNNVKYNVAGQIVK